MKLAVVIPCRNEAPYIEECIRAIYACTLPSNTSMDVVVVDGMSTDGTRTIVEGLKKEIAGLHLCDNTKQLTPFAFNLGIHFTATPDYVQIVGARHILSADYLEKCISALHENEDIWCVGGRIDNVFENDKGEYIAHAMSTSFGMGIGNFRALERSGFTDTVTSPMYPWFVFEKIGFFDEELVRNQDDEFNFRVTQAGGKIYYIHDISLKYYVRGDYRKLWRQFFQYGYWKVYVNKKHKAVTTLRQLVPPLFSLYILSLPIYLFVHPSISLLANFVLGVYMFLALLSAFNRSKSFIQNIETAAVFPILHLSYGLGYLNGIVRFLIFRMPPKANRSALSR